MLLIGRIKGMLFVSLLILSGEAKAVEPFDRHYIIVVDQTVNLSNANKIYKSLCAWLNGKDPSDYLNKEGSTIPELRRFDTEHDAISLFAFGLSGDGKMRSDYGRIHRNCYENRESAENIFNDILASLIKQRHRYMYGSICSADGNKIKKMSLSDFLSTDMQKLFNGLDPLRISIGNESGITMSHFVYPLIMKFISKEEYANEYYLILVSDFKSGLHSNNDEEDWKRLSEMTAGKQEIRNFFERQINITRAPFVQADYLHFQAGDVGAKGTRLIMKSLIHKSQIFLSSSLTLSQLSGNIFKVSSATIEFDKDPLTTIDSIQIVLNENDNVLCRKTIEREDGSIASLLKENRKYEIPSQEVDLGKDSLGDITINYIFYTMAQDASNKPVLPVTLKATQNISKDDISMIDKELRRNMTITTVVLLAMAVFVTLILRGRKKFLSAQIGTFAQKYVNVTGKEGAVELPCWFYHEGENTKSIRVNGFLKKKGFSIGGNVKVFARLQDGKPEGFRYYIDRKNAANYVEVKRNGYNVSFNINIEMLPEKVNPAELSTCKVKLDFMIESRIFGLIPRQDVMEDIDEIEFYFMNDLGTAWVGFDPGTTGSCVSFGCTGGPLDNPNIRMVKDTSGSDIIPSKIILNKDFGDSPLEMLSPGEDYWYGRRADENWQASNRKGMPCFQSIKKLLGYKNSADDMMEVKWGQHVRKLTGLQLAHLLVKGLKIELDKNVNLLSSADAVRYVGKNGRAKRAVVAIPNNYTLPKITDMVNSVRMLNAFDEVRYIYEAEGILFNYFRKNYKKQKPGTETIMVYDMGGATINISIFRVNYTQENGTIYYNVHTLGRIGYAVGGDNIDVAIMEYLFTLPQLTTSLTEKEKGQNPKYAEDLEKLRHEYQLLHKIDLIDAVRALKLDIVNAEGGNNLERNRLANSVVFEDFIKNFIIQQFATLPDNSFAKYQGDFARDIIRRIKDSKSLKQYVIQNVEDAVREIIHFPEIESLSSIDTLVFAGRSTLFPGIRECVTNTLEERFKKFGVYDRFNSDEIKTSVSYGACWYGIYNSLVTLDNSRLSCAYGFKITQSGNTKLEVLLNQNDVFDEDGFVSQKEAITNHFDADGNVVDFYQVMGSGKGENLFSEENRHKVNYIGSIDVTTTTSKIGMSVDRRNVVTCTVSFDTGDTSSFKDLNVVGRDITKENDWAYVFAVTPPTKTQVQYQADLRRPEQPRSNTSTARPGASTTRPESGGAKRV